MELFFNTSPKLNNLFLICHFFSSFIEKENKIVLHRSAFGHIPSERRLMNPLFGQEKVEMSQKVWKIKQNCIPLHQQIPPASHKNSVPSGTFFVYRHEIYQTSDDAGTADSDTAK